MGPAQAWKALGIKPTADRREVRRAYSAKLKAIDPDADIAGFQRLREARAVAERLASFQAQIAAPDGEAPESKAPTMAAGISVLATPVFGFADPGGQPAPPPKRDHDKGSETVPKPAPVSVPAPGPPVDPQLAQRRRFANLLARSHLSEEKAAELHDLFAEMLADKRMEQVDFAEELEQCFAQQLLHAIPRSDPLISKAVQHFGWARELTSVRPRYAPAAVARRGEDLRCIASLSEPEHKWNAAFLRLQEPAPTSIAPSERYRFHKEFNALLASLRWYNPAVENLLDAKHVAMWSDSPSLIKTKHGQQSGDDGFAWMAVFGAIWLLVIVSRFVAQSNTPDPLDEQHSASEPVSMPVEQATATPRPIQMPDPTLLPWGHPDEARAISRELSNCLKAKPVLLPKSKYFDCQSWRDWSERHR